MPLWHHQRLVLYNLLPKSLRQHQVDTSILVLYDRHFCYKHFSTLQRAYFVKQQKYFQYFSLENYINYQKHFITFQWANTSNTRSILVLSNSQIYQILQAFSELETNISRNQAIIWAIIVFFSEGYMRLFAYSAIEADESLCGNCCSIKYCSMEN